MSSIPIPYPMKKSNGKGCACHPHNLQTLRKAFPVLVQEKAFVQQTYDKLHEHGFMKENTIPCVSLCRDELTAPFLHAIEAAWYDGEDDSYSFIMHSLAGMVFLGKTGLTAAVEHAPCVNGVARYVFYVFPHIGVNAEGTIGRVPRDGIDEDSSACGALIALQEQMHKGVIDLELDTDDIEQSILRVRILKKVKIFGTTEIPSLVDLTHVAHQVGLQDLERLIPKVFKEESHDYAVITGVQINGGGQLNYIWPSKCYAVVNGTKYSLDGWNEH